MWQPRWDVDSICRNIDIVPEDLEVDISAHLRSKVSPGNRVRIQPNIKFERSLPHRCEFGATVPSHKCAHLVRGQCWDTQKDQVVLAFQIRNIKTPVHDQTNRNFR